MSVVDRLYASFERFVRRVAEPRIDYLAAYPARVVKQAGDGTLELQPDSPRLPGMAGIQIRYGLPGIAAIVAVGSRVLIVFEGGDPAAPIATIWEADGLVELTITAATRINVNAPDVRLAGGTRPVACLGDIVQVSGLAPSPAIALTNSGGPVTGAITLVGQIVQTQSTVKGP